MKRTVWCLGWILVFAMAVAAGAEEAGLPAAAVELPAATDPELCCFGGVCP